MLKSLADYVGRHHIGLLALAVATASTSYAAVNLPVNSVGKQQLKRSAVTNAKLGSDAVTSKKVRNGTLLVEDFKAGQLTTGQITVGAQGPAGLVGPRGLPGESGTPGIAGAAGAPGISGYERIERAHNVAPGDTSIIVSASCPAGKKLLGGGAVVQDSKFHITYLFPQANDVMALTAVVLPGQTITTTSQAFVVAICGRVA